MSTSGEGRGDGVLSGPPVLTREPTRGAFTEVSRALNLDLSGLEIEV